MANRKASGIPILKSFRSSPRLKSKNDSNLIISGSPNSIFNYQHPDDDEKILTKDVILKAKETGVLQLNEKGLITVIPVALYLEDGENALSKDLREELKRHEEVPLFSIDLSRNQISDVPSAFSKVHSLTTLNLEHNKLEKLPDELSDLHNLVELNLNNNNFKQIPKFIFSLLKLKILNLSHNELTEVDYDMGDVVTLNTVDFSFNKIRIIPISMCQLIAVTSLNLQNNEIKELPLELKFLTALETFKVGKNEVLELPTFEFMPNIQSIDASWNQISSFPCLRMCHRLKELRLGHNQIMVITAENIENLSSISMMDISFNNIARLPDELGYLSSLTVLNVESNSLTELPNTLCKLSNLKLLSVQSNPLSIRQDILIGGTNRILQFLSGKFQEKRNVPPSEELSSSLSEKNYQMPDKYVLKKRRALNLCGFNLSVIPDSVLDDAAEAEVQLVDLKNNLLTDVPAPLSKLSKSLQELVMSKNRIVSISENIKPFKNLWFLDLGSNRLSSLPEEFSELENLREVDLSFNLFTEMPLPLFSCSQVERISFENNKIAEFNVEGLSRLTRLAVLNLTNNDLQHIPPQVGNLTQLIDLQLTGNGIRHPRREILEKDTYSLLSWLRFRIP